MSAPVRGSDEDWSAENEERLLKEKKAYAKRVAIQQRKGVPDFSSMFGADDLKVDTADEFVDPVTFKLAKAYRPSLRIVSELQKEPEGTKIKEQLQNIRIDSNYLQLAQQRISVMLKEMTVLKFSRDSANTNLCLVTIVSDGNPSNPVNLRLSKYDNIKKGERLPVGRGLLMYEQSNYVPEYLDVRFLLAHYSSNMNVTEIKGRILNNSEYKNGIREMTSVLNSIVETVKQLDVIVGIVGAILKLQPPDQLLYYAATFSKDYDNLGVGTVRDETDYVKFCYNISVGAKSKESKRVKESTV